MHEGDSREGFKVNRFGHKVAFYFGVITFLKKHVWLFLLCFLRFATSILAFSAELANQKGLRLQTSIDFLKRLYRCIVHISFCKNQSIVSFSPDSKV